MVRMMDFDEPYWLEDPSTVISPIKAFIKKGGGYDLDEMTQTLAQGREKAIANLLQKVPADEKPWFEALIMLGGQDRLLQRGTRPLLRITLSCRHASGLSGHR